MTKGFLSHRAHQPRLDLEPRFLFWPSLFLLKPALAKREVDSAKLYINTDLGVGGHDCLDVSSLPHSNLGLFVKLSDVEIPGPLAKPIVLFGGFTALAISLGSTYILMTF